MLERRLANQNVPNRRVASRLIDSRNVLLTAVPPASRSYAHLALLRQSVPPCKADSLSSQSAPAGDDPIGPPMDRRPAAESDPPSPQQPHLHALGQRQIADE